MPVIEPDDWRDQIIISSDDEVMDKDSWFGVFPIRQDIEVLPADSPKQLKLGWTVREVIGVGVFND